MSVFGDFQQVWLQRFPDSALPSAWEEDIRANLEKHKQKVSTLKEELEKEEVYVEYLERLISDIEGHKKKVEKKTEKEEIFIENNDESLSKDHELNLEPTAPPCESPHCENSVNKCISELSAILTTKTSSSISNDETEIDITNNVLPSSFVTVIEVNGLKNNAVTLSPAKQQPPLPPAKPKLLSMSSRESLPKSNSVESVKSSQEQLTPIDEPYYDMVALDYEENHLLRSEASSTENMFSNSSTLPLHLKHASLQSQQSVEPPSPEPQSNYVNIEYFIHKNLEHSDEEEDNDEGIQLRKNNDSGSYASSSSLECSTPATRRKYSQVSVTDSEKLDGEKSSIYKSILLNIIASESNYVDWLQVLLTYMKAIKATLGTSQPVISEGEFKTIFYKIPELHLLHSNFLDSVKKHSKKWDTRVGDSFKIMAENLELYGAFLSNYGRAVDTAKRCSDANSQFCNVSKNITCKHLSGQPISLEDLLHKPVARVQKNAMVLHDLLKATPPAHLDHHSLANALSLTQKFLDQFNMIQTKSMFPATDRAQRRLVKNSFIVEFVDGNRKLRHLFLFNDVIACAKYKSSGRSDKYTFELKWFISVEDICILEESMANPHEVPSTDIVNLKSQASNARDQIRLEEKAADEKKIRMGRGSEKVRKRLLDLESQLVLVAPNLMFRIRHRQQQKQYTFFLSSDFERTQWIETIHTLQQTSRPPAPNSTFSMLELQTWITACRTYLKTNMGSYLLRSGHDESLLVGDLHITLYDMQGLEYAADLFICIEVDFYGHFFRKARSKVVCKSNNPVWNESFVLDLEGCENLRILVYRESGSHITLFGKHTQQLSIQWLQPEQIEKKLHVNGCELRVGLKFIPFEVSMRRVPGKCGPLFGEKISQICKRQKRDIPFIVSACVREVERRGMSEVGIYRVSGSASDLARLKKSFETNSYEAEQLLKEVDIHSVSGILRSYLRELPEALYTDALYPFFLEAFNHSNENLTRRTELLNECFKKLPKENKATIEFLLEHLIRIHQHENENKMSLHNLATVFGPTLLRSSGKIDNKAKIHLASETVDVMAQAGILYCFLQDKNLHFRKEC